MPERTGRLSEEKRARLQQFLRGESVDTPHATNRILRRPPEVEIPLSSQQQQRWHSACRAPGVPIDTDFITVTMRGPIDVVMLQTALEHVVARHEILRTTIALRADRPIQVVSSAAAVQLSVFDVREAADVTGEATRIARAEARRGIALVGGPLWRAVRIRVTDDEHRLVLIIHHLVADCHSEYNIFLPELATAYAALVAGRTVMLPALALQYGDYAVWQHSHTEAPLANDAVDFWRTRLDPDRATVLSSDHPRDDVATFEGAVEFALLPAAVVARLEALSRAEATTLFMTLFAGVQLVLRERTGADETFVATETGNRHPPELWQVLGVFLNTLILRTDLSRTPTFRELIQRVRQETTEALNRGRPPFLSLLKGVGRDHSTRPFYQIMVRVGPPYAALVTGWEVSAVDIDPGASKVDVTIDFYHLPRGIVARLEYDSRQFDRGTAARLLDDLVTLLGRAADAPDTTIDDLSHNH